MKHIRVKYDHFPDREEIFADALASHETSLSCHSDRGG